MDSTRRTLLTGVAVAAATGAPRMFAQSAQKEQPAGSVYQEGDASATASADYALSSSAARDLAQQYAADAAQVSGVDTAKRASVATAKSLPIAAAIQRVLTDFYAPSYGIPATLKGGAHYRRATKTEIDAYSPALPSRAYWRHNIDRTTPGGSPDATEGGYFLIDEHDLSANMFGAVVDNTSDDEPAISAAFATGEAFGGRTVNLTEGISVIGATVTCGALSTVNAASGAKLRYSGSGDAMVIVGRDTANRFGRNHFIPSIQRKDTVDWDLGTDSSSVGLRIIDCKYDNFYISAIRRFDRGLVLQALNANCICNKFYLGPIQNNRISISFGDVTIPWGVNQNSFYGGACIIDAAYTTTTNRIFVNMPNIENNANTFIGVNLEKGGNQKAIVSVSSSNLWLDCRFEGGGTTAGYVTLSGNNNRLIGGAPSSSDTPPFATWVSDAGSGNVYWMANILSSKFFAIDFHDLRSLRFGNGVTFPAMGIGSYGTDGLSFGDSNLKQIRYSGAVLQEGAAQTTGASIPLQNSTLLSYSSVETIVSITGGAYSDVTGLFGIVSTNANASLQHTASPMAGQGRFVLKGGANLALSANVPVLFMLAGGNLYQV